MHASRITATLQDLSAYTNFPGELLVRGPGLFSCYWGRPEATAQAFNEDDFFRTGTHQQGECRQTEISSIYQWLPYRASPAERKYVIFDHGSKYHF